MDQPEDEKKVAEDPPPARHKLLWALLGVFIVGSIAVMMLADYYYAPGAHGAAVPKDSVDK